MRNNKFEINKEPKSNAIEVRPKLGRNDSCYCGSGKKYKNCCMKKDEEKERVEEIVGRVETVSDKYFSVKEYIELSGYPVARFDFFLLEILNITGSTLYRYNKTSSAKTKEILEKLYSYSKDFYKECLTCKHNCLNDPLAKVNFKSLVDKGFDIEELPRNLQKGVAMNFFYIEFINTFAYKFQCELCEVVEEAMAADAASVLYGELIDYVSDNCADKCDNKCIIEHNESGYCKFCTFGSKSLPCPKKGEVSYDLIKAFEEDMEH